MGWIRKQLIDGVRDDEPVLNFQLLGMKVAGIWPLDNNTHRVIKFLYRHYFNFTVFCLVSTSVLSLGAVMTKMSLGSLASTVDILTMFLTAAFKMIIMQRNKENMLIILKEAQSFSRNLVVGDKGPSLFQYTRYSKLFSLLHQGLGALVITGWIFSPMIENVSYPVVVWTPEGTEDTLFYPLVYLVTGWSLLISAHVYLSQDSFLFSLLHICCFHINQIGHGLQAVDKLPSNKVAKTNNKLQGLNKLAAFHAKILNLLKTVEYNWRSMLVADLFHCIMSLSFGLFNTSVSSSLPARIKTYFFITYSFFHEFLNSYFGEMLVSHASAVGLNMSLPVVTASLKVVYFPKFRTQCWEHLQGSTCCSGEENKVSEWLYEMDWLSMSTQERRHVLFMITRAQRPVKINAWQVYDFSYPMFMELTKALLSYYMVLETLLDKSTN